MDDVSERFLEALSGLEAAADEVTPDEAAATLDDAALQVFWRMVEDGAIVGLRFTELGRGSRFDGRYRV
jgi:hypothetical protein